MFKHILFNYNDVCIYLDIVFVIFFRFTLSCLLCRPFLNSIEVYLNFIFYFFFFILLNFIDSRRLYESKLLHYVFEIKSIFLQQ